MRIVLFNSVCENIKIKNIFKTVKNEKMLNGSILMTKRMKLVTIWMKLMLGRNVLLGC